MKDCIEIDGVTKIDVEIYLTNEELEEMKTTARNSYITVQDLVQSFIENGLRLLKEAQK